MLKIITLVIILVVGGNCDFLPGRLRIVDKNMDLNNFLVRGNLPIKNNKFQLEELKGNLT